MLLNKLFEGIKQEIKNTFRQMKWKHNTKPLNTTEAALHGKFIKAYLRKQEKKSNNLNMHLNYLKIEQTQHKLEEGRI